MEMDLGACQHTTVSKDLIVDDYLPANARDGLDIEVKGRGRGRHDVGSAVQKRIVNGDRRATDGDYGAKRPRALPTDRRSHVSQVERRGEFEMNAKKTRTDE